MTRPGSASEREVLRECRRVLEQNSKSFALAARLLAPSARDSAAAVYAYCRRVDDAIDDAPPEQQQGALLQLREELAGIYRGRIFEQAGLRGFQALAAQTKLPERYPSELIAGMAMDVDHTVYETLDDLLLYCHRVAGVVGLMMCHVFGVTRDDAQVEAAHLGMAMQLTNICRDVKEDWTLGRLYLPRDMLRAAGAAEIPAAIEGTFPSDASTLRAMRGVMGSLLAQADRLYASAAGGIDALPWRAGLAVRAASALYHEIGVVVRSRHCDPTVGRAVVPMTRKLALLADCSRAHLLASPAFMREHFARGGSVRPPSRELVFPTDILQGLRA